MKFNLKTALIISGILLVIGGIAFAFFTLSNQDDRFDPIETISAPTPQNQNGINGEAINDSEDEVSVVSKTANPTIDDNFQDVIYPAILKFTQANRYTEEEYENLTKKLGETNVTWANDAMKAPFVSFYNEMNDGQAFGSLNDHHSFSKNDDGTYMIELKVKRAVSVTAGLRPDNVASNIQRMLADTQDMIYMVSVSYKLTPSDDRMSAVLTLETPDWYK
jgi:hypothetical protein